MGNTFGKVWRVQIDTVVTDAHDVAFQIVKTLKRQPNTCSLTIWNLSADQRKAIESLSIPSKSEAGKKVKPKGKIRVQVEAGYEGNTSLLFRGDLRTAITVREGPDLVTTVEGDDGGRDVLLSRISRSYPGGTLVKTVLRDLVASLGVGSGNFDTGEYRTRAGEIFPGGTVLTGKADENLTRLLHSCGYTWSVQNGALQVLKAGKALATQAVLLTPQTGLVGTPSVSPEGHIQCQALLVPGVYPGGRVKIQCPTLTGLYFVHAVEHVGDSAAVGEGSWDHNLELKP